MDSHQRIRLLQPLYLLLDASQSMTHAETGLRDGLMKHLLSWSFDHPAIADIGWLCIISFGSEARVEVPLTEISEIETIHRFEISPGGSAYGPAFALARREIESDVHRLKATSRVFRPVVIFVSDGYPTDPDSWLEELRRLQESPYRPSMIALGVGAVDPNIISQIAPDSAFVSRIGVTQDAACEQVGMVAAAVLNSLSSSIAVGQSRTSNIRMPDDFVPAVVSTV